jgi:hypothetical protein
MCLNYDVVVHGLRVRGPSCESDDVLTIIGEWRAVYWDGNRKFRYAQKKLSRVDVAWKTYQVDMLNAPTDCYEELQGTMEFHETRNKTATRPSLVADLDPPWRQERKEG